MVTLVVLVLLDYSAAFTVDQEEILQVLYRQNTAGLHALLCSDGVTPVT